MFPVSATRLAALLFFLIGILSLSVSRARAAVDPTTGEYRTEVVDLSVKVVGGALSFSREYEANAWRFVPGWSALRLEVDALDDTVARIDRAGDLYEKIDSAGTLYRFDQRLTIRKTESGWRWADRDGNWMEYTVSGQPQRFGNRIGNVVTLNYSGDKLTSVVDPMNRTVFTVTWNGNQIASVKDYTDREVRYGYTGSLLTQVIDMRGKVWTYQYTDGKLSTLIDPLQHKTVIALSATGRARSVTDPAGAVTRYAFDYLSGPKQYYLKTIRENGELQEVTEIWTDRERELVRQDVNGVTVLKVARDGRNRIHTDYRGRRTTYLYDEFRNSTGVIYPDGSKVTHAYDTSTSNLLSTTDERGTVAEHQYYSNGLRRRTIEAKGTGVERITEYGYDPQGRLSTITQVGDAVTQEVVTRYTYDAAGNVETITDAEQGVTRFEDYDAMGNARTRIDARQKAWRDSFDAAGNLLAVTNPLLQTTSHEYDDAGRRSKTIYPPANEEEPAATTAFSYDDTDRLVATTDALGGTRHTVYDAIGNRVEERDESDKKTNYTYDAFNRLSAIVDGSGNTTRYVYPDPVNPGPDAGDLYQPITIEFPTFKRELKYDRLNRPWSQRDVFVSGGQTRGQSRTVAFDSAGNAIESVDSANRSTYHEYDALGRLAKTTDADGGETTFAYDTRDNLILLTDANTHAYRFTYDRLNRSTVENRPLGQSYKFRYDPAGNLIEKTDSRDQRSVFGYDDAGRRENSRFYGAGAATPRKTISFTYNRRGALSGYDDGTTSANYVHDVVQRKVAESVDYGDFTWTHRYTYFPNGQKKSYTAVDGSTVSYGYDAAKQLQSISIPGEGSIQFTDFFWMRPRRVTFPGGPTRVVSYDGALRTEEIQLRSSSNESLMDSRYVYDDAGNITTKHTEHGIYRYEYDNLDRLKAADYPNGQNNDQVGGSGGFPFADDRYSYDSLGNRLTDERKSAATQWEYNDNNELLSSGAETFEYNANGSMVVKKDRTTQRVLAAYAYDSAERLSEVRDGEDQLAAEYYYDPFGRRLWKTVYPLASEQASGATAQRHYISYSDEGFAAEFLRSASSVGAPPAEAIRLHLFAPGGLWSTGLIASRSSQANWLFPGLESNGQVTLLTEGASGTTVRMRSTAFGERQEAGPEFTMGFPGQLWDAEAGTAYNRYRNYSPSLGRYTSSDPIGIAGGLSRYEYANSSPLRYVDPLGKQAQPALPDPAPAPQPRIPIPGGPPANDPVYRPNPGPGLGGILRVCARVLGTAAGTAGGVVVGVLIPNETAACNDFIPKPECPQYKCRPCVPPIGTTCYGKMNSGHEHKGMDPHWHGYIRTQTPFPECKCRWNKLRGIEHTYPSAPTGLAPCSSFPDFVDFYPND